MEEAGRYDGANVAFPGPLAKKSVCMIVRSLRDAVLDGLQILQEAFSSSEKHHNEFAFVYIVSRRSSAGPYTRPRRPKC